MKKLFGMNVSHDVWKKSKDNLKTGKDDVLMVDIGCTTGSQIINFKQQFSELPGRYILQDLQPPKALDDSLAGVEVVQYNFFTPQPIRGARYYYFRNVFHDWSDSKAAEMFHNVKLLRGAVEEILMMLSLNALERTHRQYELLVVSVGMEIEHISIVGANEEAIIEARIKR